MSIVGTRPPTLDEWNKYELHHRARLAKVHQIKSKSILIIAGDGDEKDRLIHLAKKLGVKEVFYRQHIDNHKSYCYSRYNISGKQFLNRSVI